MADRLKTARTVATAAVGTLLLGFPVLSLADTDARVLGVPALYAYLFAAWLVVIGLVALAIRLSR